MRSHHFLLVAVFLLLVGTELEALNLAAHLFGGVFFLAGLLASFKEWRKDNPDV